PRRSAHGGRRAAARPVRPPGETARGASGARRRRAAAVRPPGEAPRRERHAAGTRGHAAAAPGRAAVPRWRAPTPADARVDRDAWLAPRTPARLHRATR